MLRNFLSVLPIHWVLWARIVGVASTWVDDSQTNQISYSEGWVQCPGSDAACPNGQINAYNNTVHMRGSTADNGRLSFNFSFFGDSITLFFVTPFQVTTTPSLLVNLSIDQGLAIETGLATSTGVLYQLGVPDGQHTLRAQLRDSSISFDRLVYDTLANTGTTGSPPNESHTALGPIIGGTVSGITVFIVAIAGILWYRFKKKDKLHGTTPFLEEAGPERPSLDATQPHMDRVKQLVTPRPA